MKISRGAICACELPKYAKASQPAVSQHLKVLLGAKLVDVKEEGVKRVYSLSRKGTEVLKDISRW
jgi:DNA-binding transcriptional ArsR family regulator